MFLDIEKLLENKRMRNPEILKIFKRFMEKRLGKNGKSYRKRIKLQINRT
jgi:hypothetical protein